MHRICFSVLAVAAGVAGFVVAGRVAAEGEKAKCPVSGKEVELTDKTPSVFVNGQRVAFCCMNCPKAFAAEPEKYVKDAGKCPVNKGGAAKISKESRRVVNNNIYYFCCANCPKAFAADPSKFVKELRDPVTGKIFAVKADSPRAEVNGQVYVFAGPDSKEAFEKESAKYVVVFK